MKHSRLSVAANLKPPMRALIWFSLATNILLLSVPLHMLQVYDRVLSSRSMETLIYLTLIVIMALAAYAVAEALRGKVAQRLSSRFTLYYSDKVFSYLTRNTKENHDPNKVLKDMSTVQNYLASRQFINLFDLPFFPLFLILMFLLHITLGLVALAGLIVMVFVAILNHAATAKAAENSSKSANEASGFSLAVMRRAEDVRAMGLLPSIMERWGQKTANSLQNADTMNAQTSFYYGISRFVRQSLQVFVMAWGGYLVLTGDMSGGMIFAATMLLGKTLMPVEQLIGGWKAHKTAREAYNAVLDISSKAEQAPTQTQLPAPKGHILVENLVYNPGAEAGAPPLLNNISFAVQPGEILAVIGSSGAGKSTIARLISGAISPTSGVIRLDHFDLEQWPEEQRGQAIGYVPQDIVLFPGTIAENIARLAPQPNDQRVVQAAQLAGVHELIAGLPDGYATKIGPDKMPLSGGQRQRIALARAFYSLPKVLVLDEPNAHLDPQGEALLDRSLQTAKQAGVAVIVISQRQSILKNADRIMVVEQGQIRSIQQAQRQQTGKPRPMPIKVARRATRPDQAGQGAQNTQTLQPSAARPQDAPGQAHPSPKNTAVKQNLGTGLPTQQNRPPMPDAMKKHLQELHAQRLASSNKGGAPHE